MGSHSTERNAAERLFSDLAPRPPTGHPTAGGSKSAGADAATTNRGTLPPLFAARSCTVTHVDQAETGLSTVTRGRPGSTPTRRSSAHPYPETLSLEEEEGVPGGPGNDLVSGETYPPNLSISISGGKETNRDSLSKGD